MVQVMGKFSSFTTLDVITDDDLFLVTDDTTDASRGVTYATIKDTLFRDDINLNSDSELRLKLQQYSTNTDAPDISFYKARGSAASPAAVNTSDNLSRHIAYAYTGGSYLMGGSLGFTASDSTGNASFTLKSRVNGSFATRLQVTNDGKIRLNGDTTIAVSSSHNPVNNGELAIEATNDTTLTFKLKGSDGTVRTATLSLS